MSTQNRTQARNKAPTSSHPLFPAIVALWFGALFGLGSFAVRPSLLESLVISSRLDMIAPITAPPLGMTARILLALAMAVIGIVAGAMIARRIARPKPIKRRRRRGAGGAEGAAERKDDTGQSEAQATKGMAVQAEPAYVRRRALVPAQDAEARSDSRLDAAPLPGRTPEIFDVTQIDLDTPEAAEITAVDAIAGTVPTQSVEAASGLMAADRGYQSDASDSIQPLVFDATTSVEPAKATAQVEPTAGELRVPPEGSAAAGSPPMPRGSAAARIASAELAELSPVELIERFALALQNRRHVGPVPTGLVDVAASFAQPEFPIFDRQSPEQAGAEVIAAPESVDASAALAVQENSTAETSDASPAAPPLPLALPAALQPIDFADYEDLDDQPSYVPPRSIAMPAPVKADAASDILDFAIPDSPDPMSEQVAAEAKVEAETEGDVIEEGYSSLLDLGRSAQLRQSFPRIEEPIADNAVVEPVVVFPGQDARAGTRFTKPANASKPGESDIQELPAAATLTEASESPTARRFDAPAGSVSATGGNKSIAHDSAEAERALRSALATLQRMSGAA